MLKPLESCKLTENDEVPVKVEGLVSPLISICIVPVGDDMKTPGIVNVSGIEEATVVQARLDVEPLA